MLAKRKKRISHEAHLAEVMVDTVNLRLVQILVQFLGQSPGRREVVAEGLFDDDARISGQAGFC